MRDGKNGNAIIGKGADWFYFAGGDPGLGSGAQMPEIEMIPTAGERVALGLDWRETGTEE
ncbi:MAG: hypothetical protein ACI8XO_003710 [Verrucomicrobiales bacterium]|jgi:hypothetical protein